MKASFAARATAEGFEMLCIKKRMDRRQMLRGIGACVPLPFLDAMAAAQTSLPAAKMRLACIEMVHGAAGCSDIGKHLWSPAKEGSNFTFSYSLEPLGPWREHVTIVSGTDVRAAEAIAPAEVGADHFRSSAAFLTAAHCKQTAGADYQSGISMDQVYAREAGKETRVPSIQLGIEYLEPTNSCGFDYNCVYWDAISWASPTTPLLPVINPRVVFSKLFGGGAGRGSVLDATMVEAGRLRAQLGAGDRNRMNGYLQEVRDVELRIEAIERHNASGEKRELYTAPIGVPDSWETHVKLMFDMQVLAFAGDVTRVSSFKMSHDVSNRIFPESGVREPFHTLSHHNEAPGQIAKFAKLNRYHVSLIPYFLERLKKTPDGDGSLLDHSLVLYGSPMGDSQTHNHRRVPLFLAGGHVQGNLHRACPSGTPLANVLLTILHKAGVREERFGDSTGTVDI